MLAIAKTSDRFQSSHLVSLLFICISVWWCARCNVGDEYWKGAHAQQ